MASTYREPNRPQNNRDFGTYGESFPPYSIHVVLLIVETQTLLLNINSSLMGRRSHRM